MTFSAITTTGGIRIFAESAEYPVVSEMQKSQFAKAHTAVIASGGIILRRRVTVNRVYVLLAAKARRRPRD